MNKAKEICNKKAPGVPYVMIISYILDKGESLCRGITDEQIAELEGNPLMTKEFIQAMVTAAREICRECDQSEFIRLIKAEWCCGDEVYDPELDQFVTDTNNY